MYYLLYVFSKNKSLIKKYANLLKISRTPLLDIIPQFTRTPALGPTSPDP